MTSLYDAVSEALTDLQPVMLLGIDELMLAIPYRKLLIILSEAQDVTEFAIKQVMRACEEIVDCAKFAENADFTGNVETAETLNRVNRGLSPIVASHYACSDKK